MVNKIAKNITFQLQNCIFLPVLAHTFLRNEPALTNTIEGLRRALAPHRGHFEPSWEEFLTILGPPTTPSTISPPLPPPLPSPLMMLVNSTGSDISSSQEDAVASSSSVAGVSTIVATTEQQQPSTGTDLSTPIPLTELSVKEILRSLGRVFELYAALIKKLGYGIVNPGSTDVIDNNRVAYVICQVMNQVAEMLQYTYRQKMHNIAKNLTKQVPKLKERIESAIAKAKEVQNSPVAVVPGLKDSEKFLQVLPAMTFPPLMENPQIRYSSTEKYLVA
jgi:hypothetical protein